jgi:hypothetical protein
MSAVLREHQHEISTLDGSRALVFGTEDTGYLTLSRPTFAGGDVRAADVERSQEDGMAFGRDYLGSKTVTFEVGVLTDELNMLDDGDAHRANLDHLDTLEGWWRDERFRNRATAMAVLRSHEAGQTWRCYGRPRAYEESAGRLTTSGYTPVVCSFALIDDRYYSDAVEQVEATLVPPPEGGIVFPLTSAGPDTKDKPGASLFTSTLETEGHTIARVTGARATWPWVEFHGPVLNPRVDIGELRIGLVGNLRFGESVTVDPRPWKRTVLRSDGANLAGWLDPDTPALRHCLLYPGDHDVIFRGNDQTATARAVVSWRQARNRP